MKNIYKLDDKKFIILTSIIVIVLFYSIFRLSGTRTIIALVLLYMLPVYYILTHFEFSESEKATTVEEYAQMETAWASSFFSGKFDLYRTAHKRIEL